MPGKSREGVACCNSFIFHAHLPGTFWLVDAGQARCHFLRALLLCSAGCVQEGGGHGLAHSRLRPASRSGGPGRKDNSTLSASPPPWGLVLRTQTSPHPHGLWLAPTLLLPTHECQAKEEKLRPARRVVQVLPVCAVHMLGWAEAPTRSQSPPVSATSQAAPDSGYLCQARMLHGHDHTKHHAVRHTLTETIPVGSGRVQGPQARVNDMVDYRAVVRHGPEAGVFV